MGLNVGINGDSPGDRIMIALAVVCLCVEMLSDNRCAPLVSPAMTIEACADLCYGQDSDVRRVDATSCECASELPPEPPPGPQP